MHFVLLGLCYNIPSPVVEILTLWSPHKLLKNVGALSEYAKCIQSSNKIFFEILTLYPGYDGMLKKHLILLSPLKNVGCFYLQFVEGKSEVDGQRLHVLVHMLQIVHRDAHL